MRVPVIASDVGGIPTVVDSGRTGVLVPPRDPDALARAIVRVLTQPELAAELSRAGRELVTARFTWESRVEATARVFESLVATETTDQPPANANV